MMHRPLKIRDTPPLHNIRNRTIRFNVRIWILEFAPLFGRIRSFIPRFFLSSIFFRQLPSEFAERNSTKTGQMLGSKCDLKMYIRNLGYPLPLQILGSKPPVFDDFPT